MQRNSMAYGHSTFEFRKRALCKSLDFWDFSDVTAINGFTISGTEPEGTARRFVFEVDGKLFVFGNSGVAPYNHQDTLDDILEYGNCAADLLAVTSVPDWLGKQVRCWIALSAPANAPVFPKAKIAARVISFNDIYTTNDFSPIYNINGKIASINADTFTNGNATVTCYVRLFNGDWSPWMFLPDAKFKAADKIQFRAHYVLTTLDRSDEARVNSISCNFIAGKEKIAASTQSFITRYQSYPHDLQTCYVLVNHQPLNRATIRAFVNFASPIIQRRNVILGTTDGSTQSFLLANGSIPDSCVAQDSLHIELDGKPCTDFFFDTATGYVTLHAPADKIVTASYDVLAEEIWREMTPDFSTLNQSRFTYRAPDFVNKRLVAVKVDVTRTEGTVDLPNVLTGTGKVEKLVALDVLPNSISTNAAFNLDNPILNILAPIGATVNLSYRWRAPVPAINKIICGFSVP